MNKYGIRLRELREERGYTQEELANLLQVSRSSLAMYEQGKRQPNFEMQELLADYFNVSIDYLFGRKNDPDLSYLDERTRKFLEMYQKASPDIQKTVENFLKASQQ